MFLFCALTHGMMAVIFLRREVLGPLAPFVSEKRPFYKFNFIYVTYLNPGKAFITMSEESANYRVSEKAS